MEGIFLYTIWLFWGFLSWSIRLLKFIHFISGLNLMAACSADFQANKWPSKWADWTSCTTLIYKWMDFTIILFTNFKIKLFSEKLAYSLRFISRSKINITTFERNFAHGILLNHQNTKHLFTLSWIMFVLSVCLFVTEATQYCVQGGLQQKKRMLCQSSIQAISIVTGLEPAILRSEVWCLIR